MKRRLWNATSNELEDYYIALSRRAGISTRYLSARWSDLKIQSENQRKIIKAILQYAKGFNDMYKRGVSTVWLGSPGTGKTMLASILAMHIIRSGYKVQVVDWCDTIINIQAADRFDSDKTKKQIYTDLLYPDLLIIDEIESDIDKRAQKEMQRIIDKRYKEVLPTVLIGNLDMDELQQAAGDRVLSRIRQSGGGILTFNWHDFRCS